MFETFANVPAYPLVFPLFWGAVVVFGLVMARHLRIFAVARAEGPSPFADIPRRTAGLVRYALVQTKMFKDRRAGLMHFGIFWGFVLLTIGTANIVTGGLVQAIISVPFDGMLWTAGLGDAERRRGRRPRRDRLRVLPAARDEAEAADAQPVRAPHPGDDRRGRRDGAPRPGLRGGHVRGHPGGVRRQRTRRPARVARDGGHQTAFAVLWWAHIALVAAFLVYLPFSKHLHIVTSFFNIYYRKLAPRGELPAMDLEDETATFGLRTLQDLGWKDLLDGFTCTECGRCQAACPANATGKPLDPKAFIMGIREMSVDAEHGIDLIPNSPIVRDAYGLDDTQPDATRLATAVVDTAIPYDAVWDCVTCGACVEACPVLIEHVDKIVGLRRNLVLEDSRFPAELTAAFTNMERAGNPWGQPKTTRTDWTKGLPFEVPTVAELAAADRLGEIDVLYWVGCAAAFDERNRRVARAFATCLDAAGIRFAILGQEESCTGDPARRMGNDYVWQLLAAGNVATLDRYDIKSIVTACPALLQHDRQRIRPARRPLRDRPPLGLPPAPARRRTAADDRRGRQRRHRAADRDVPRLVLHGPLQRRRGPAARGPRVGRRASSSSRWTARARTASAAARAAAGCGWRRPAGRGSTPSGPARRSRPGRGPWRRTARSA